MDWQLLTDVASIVASLSIVLVLVQVLREVRSQNLQSLFYLHQYLSQEDFSRSRKHLRTILVNRPYAEWSEEDRVHANRVCASYDQAGILISVGILDKRTRRAFLASSWGASIIDQYRLLSDFLDAEQAPGRSGREFFRHFGDLVAEAELYQRGAQ